MICRYQYLRNHASVFKALTGLRVKEFERLVADLLPNHEQTEEKRLSRAGRKRAMGGGRNFELDGRDQILLSVIWLRKYPTQEVLGYLFGVSDTTVGRDTRRMPHPGRKQRR
jgi:hypothetical protein